MLLIIAYEFQSPSPIQISPESNSPLPPVRKSNVAIPKVKPSPSISPRPTVNYDEMTTSIISDPFKKPSIDSKFFGGEYKALPGIGNSLQSLNMQNTLASIQQMKREGPHTLKQPEHDRKSFDNAQKYENVRKPFDNAQKHESLRKSFDHFQVPDNIRRSFDTLQKTAAYSELNQASFEHSKFPPKPIYQTQINAFSPREPVAIPHDFQIHGTKISSSPHSSIPALYPPRRMSKARSYAPERNTSPIRGMDKYSNGVYGQQARHQDLMRMARDRVRGPTWPGEAHENNRW